MSLLGYQLNTSNISKAIKSYKHLENIRREHGTALFFTLHDLAKS